MSISLTYHIISALYALEIITIMYPVIFLPFFRFAK